ncbi:MAG TPA: ABC transporter permease [Streptosporangiaceae bacterium]|nr:ABC transporter permease [Streptosporangiaceae bacterium]
MSETAERAPVSGPPADPAAEPGRPGIRASSLGRIGIRLIQQREATVFIVAVALVIYFSSVSSAFFTRDDLVNLSQIIAPLAIIACGEVLLLICGELDLSVGFVYGFAPFLMHYLIDFYGVPAIPAMILCLVFGLVFGYINAFITIALGVPSFIATLGTGLILLGLTLTTSNAYPALIPDSAAGPGHWIGTYAWSMITWAIVLVIFFQILLSRTKWGLHTVAVGGNILGASEAGINVKRIKYGNFMITGTLGAFVGLQVAFQTNSIDPSSGGYQPMFYAIAAAVIGGTVLSGGSGTIVGAFLGAVVLGILQGGFTLIGISANPLSIIFGGAILVAMIANVQFTRLRNAGRT